MTDGKREGAERKMGRERTGWVKKSGPRYIIGGADKA